MLIHTCVYIYIYIYIAPRWFGTRLRFSANPPRRGSRRAVSRNHADLKTWMFNTLGSNTSHLLSNRTNATCIHFYTSLSSDRVWRNRSVSRVSGNSDTLLSYRFGQAASVSRLQFPTSFG